MLSDGTQSRTLAPSIETRGTGDWSPDGDWIVIGGADTRGPALFLIPVAGGDPIRLVDGESINPIWSPRDNLILYGGTFVAGQVPLRGVRPDRTRVDLNAMSVRPGGLPFPARWYRPGVHGTP